MWKNNENMAETLMHHQRIIIVYVVRCRISAPLMLLTTTLMNHQCYQPVFDWGVEDLSPYQLLGQKAVLHFLNTSQKMK